MDFKHPVYSLFLNFGFPIVLKKSFSILLLSCLLFNVAGYHIVFYIKQAEIKAEMKKTLLHSDNEEVSILFFSLDDKEALAKLEWEGDDEFELNGNMYDVVEKKIQDDKLIIRCISDKKETALVKSYEKINHKDNSNSRSVLLLKLINSSYLPEKNNVICIDNNLALLYISFQQEIISSYRHDVLTPPPQS
jgi:hypothetical protein